jgi:hypothetical protein
MLKFGIEIEYHGSPSAVADAMQNSGLPFMDRRNQYSGFSHTHWMLKYDGSVTHGGELVSPPLDFDDPAQRAQVTTAILAMQQAGVTPHNDAGIHIHVEASHEDGTKFTPREAAAAVRFFHKFQDIIYRIASSGWSKIRPRNSYFKPVEKDMAEKMMKVRTESALIKAWYGDSRIPTEHYDDSRYRGINLHSFFQMGTIEFRVFNSSLNPDRVQAYVALCCAIIRDVRNGYNRSVKKSYDIGGMASGETDEAKAMLRFQQIMCYESGMSKEDWKNLRKTCWNDSVPQVFEGVRY